MGNWIVCPRPKPFARLRLFCFPHAGGTASVYNNWAAGLPDTVEVCAIQLPGHESRLAEPLYSDPLAIIPDMAQAFLPKLQKPFVFWGHSLGGLICFELIHYLRKHALPMPLKLFISACRAPQLAPREPAIHTLPDREFIYEMQRLDGTPNELYESAEMMQIMLPILRADLTMYETYPYQSRPPLHCPIAARGGLQDSEVSREMLEAWREQTTGGVKVSMYPGNHFYLLQDSRAEVLGDLAQELNALVEQRSYETI
ncbi:MAG: thioesterase II family protein [Chloroflexota bacterium]